MMKNNDSNRIQLMDADSGVPLHHEQEVAVKLKGIVPENFILGTALGDGDCFFDSVATALNVIEKRDVYTAKSIRLLCDDYVKDPKNTWVEEAVKQDHHNWYEYLARIPFTAEEMEDHTENRTLQGTAIWGRPAIEGRMICDKLNIKIHLIEVHEDNQTFQGVIVLEQLISSDKSQSIESFAEEQYREDNLIHLVVAHNHFVPLLNTNLLKELKSIRTPIPSRETRPKLGNKQEVVAASPSKKSIVDSISQAKVSPHQTDSFKNRVNSELQGGMSSGYIRLPVLANGDCGYTALGITRKDAHELLTRHLSEVKHLLQPVLNELLVEETLGFVRYLLEKGVITPAQAQAGLNQEQYVNDLAVLSALIDFDVKDKRAHAGWVHAATLQALAHIRKVGLRIWILGKDQQLMPHRQEGYYDYFTYTPPNHDGTWADLLFTGVNHFERLEWVGFDGCPPIGSAIYPADIQKNDKKSPVDLGHTLSGKAYSELVEKREVEVATSSTNSMVDFVAYPKVFPKKESHENLNTTPSVKIPLALVEEKPVNVARHSKKSMVDPISHPKVFHNKETQSRLHPTLSSKIALELTEKQKTQIASSSKNVVSEPTSDLKITHNLVEALHERIQKFIEEVRVGKVVGYHYPLANLYYDLGVMFEKYYNHPSAEKQHIRSDLATMVYFFEQVIKEFPLNSDNKDRINKIDLVRKSNILLNSLSQRGDFLKKQAKNFIGKINHARIRTDAASFLKELIEVYLELGDERHVAYHLNQLEAYKLSEAVPLRQRFEFFLAIRKIIKLELEFTRPQKEDLQAFVIQEAPTLEKGLEILEAWEASFSTQEIFEGHILFLKSENSSWVAHVYFNKKITRHLVADDSLLGKFLSHYKNKPEIYTLTTEVLDLASEAGAFVDSEDDFGMHSSRKKAQGFCRALAEEYQSIGHIPLKQFFVNSEDYYKKIKKLSIEKLEMLVDPQSVAARRAEEKAQKPKKENILLSLFPVAPKFGAVYLNDPIREKPFFKTILPHVDSMGSFLKTFHKVYDLEWISCPTDDELKARLTEWENGFAEKSRQEPFEEKLLLFYVQDKKAWYFWAKLETEHVVQGYVDNLQELSVIVPKLSMLTYEAAAELNKDEKDQIFSLIKTALQLDIDEARIEALNDKKQSHVIVPLSWETHQSQQSEEVGIVLYHLTRHQDCQKLKKRILASKIGSFSVVAQVAPHTYVSILVDQERDGERKIFILDSGRKNPEYDEVLKWFEGIAEGCRYVLERVSCPSQRSDSQDSLLHAYLNASATQYAVSKGHWDFLKKNFSRQYFSSAANVEKMKLWFVDHASKPAPAFLDMNEPEKASDVHRELSQGLENFFQDIFLDLSAQEVFDRSNQSRELFGKVKNYDNLIKVIQDLDSGVGSAYAGNILERLQRLRDLSMSDPSKLSEGLDINSLVSICLNALTQATMEHLAMVAALEEARDALCALMTEVIFKVPSEHKDFVGGLFARYQQSGNFSLENYMAFVDYLQGLPPVLASESCRVALDTLRDRLSQARSVTLPQRNWEELGRLFNIFSTLEPGVLEVRRIFSGSLFHSYECVSLGEVHKKVRSDFNSWLPEVDGFFAPMKEYLDQVMDAADREIGIQKKLNFNLDSRILEKVFVALDQLKESHRPSAVTFNNRIRKEMSSELGKYTQDLATFRYNVNVALEQFEEQAHVYFLNAIKKIVQNKDSRMNIEFIAGRAKTFLSSFSTQNPSGALEAYKKLLDYLAESNFCSPAVLQALKKELDKTDHSHYSYIVLKMNSLLEMVKRFADVEEMVPRLSKMFEDFLFSKYDHLNEQLVCGPQGKMVREIFNKLKPAIDFKDMESIIRGYEDLENFFDRCGQFLKSNDKKASAEISDCFRQCLSDVANEYGRTLLAFRAGAWRTLIQFEQEFFNVFSGFNNLRLREKFRPFLSRLEVGDDEASYEKFKAAYLDLIKLIRLEGLEEKILRSPKSQPEKNYHNPVFSFGLLDRVEAVFKHPRHTLVPHRKEKCLNLSKLVHDYVEWHEEPEIFQDSRHEICKIDTNTARLSDIINLIRAADPEFFKPSQEIRILCKNILFADVDLDDPQYAGVTISILAPFVINPHNHPLFKIKTTGDDSKEKPAAPVHGEGFDGGGKGHPGKDGDDGEHGKNAGHVYVVCNNAVKMKVQANGGKGADAQHGGNGAKGRDGRHGATLDEGRLKDKYIDRWSGGWIPHNYMAIITAGQGEDGGFGGNAGFGGVGGSGGYCGEVAVLGLDEPTDLSCENVEPPIAQSGNPGVPGEAGDLGKDGLDLVLVSNSRSVWSFFTFLFDKRAIDVTKKGIVKNRAREGEWDERLNRKVFHGSDVHIPDMYSPEQADGLFAQKKEQQKKERRGKAAEGERQHRTHRQRFDGIQRQKIFNQIKMFFGQYNNPKNKQGFEHWLAPQLNQFLEKLAERENLPAYKVQDLPDVNLTAQRIEMLEEGFAQAVEALNERLVHEKINTDDLKIGNIILSEEILQQQEAFALEHQNMMESLEQNAYELELKIAAERVDVRSLLNQVAAQQRLEQQENRKEQTSLLLDLDHNDVLKQKKNPKNFSFKPHAPQKKWALLAPEIVQKFRIDVDNFSDGRLLTEGSLFIKKWSPTADTSLFMNAYLEDVRQASFELSELARLKGQEEQLSLLSKNYPDDVGMLLSHFSADISREYVRHYWIVMLQKTIPLHSEQKIKACCEQYIRDLKKADDFHLRKLDSYLSGCHFIVRLFPTGLDKGLDEAVATFNGSLTSTHLCKVIEQFSSYLERSYKTIISHIEIFDQVKIFIKTYKRNKELLGVRVGDFEKHEIKISGLLNRYPHSALHDLFLEKNYKEFLRKLLSKPDYRKANNEKENVLAWLDRLLNDIMAPGSVVDFSDIHGLLQNFLANGGGIYSLLKPLDNVIRQKISLILFAMDYKKIGPVLEQHPGETNGWSTADVMLFASDSHIFREYFDKLCSLAEIGDSELTALSEFLQKFKDQKWMSSLSQCSNEALFSYANELALLRDSLSYPNKKNWLLEKIKETFLLKIASQGESPDNPKILEAMNILVKDINDQLAVVVDLCTSRAQIISDELFFRNKKRLKFYLDALASVMGNGDTGAELIKWHENFCRKYQSLDSYFALDKCSLENIYEDGRGLITDARHVLSATLLKKGWDFSDRDINALAALFQQEMDSKNKSPEFLLELINQTVHTVNEVGFYDASIFASISEALAQNRDQPRLIEAYALKSVLSQHSKIPKGLRSKIRGLCFPSESSSLLTMLEQCRGLYQLVSGDSEFSNAFFRFLDPRYSGSSISLEKILEITAILDANLDQSSGILRALLKDPVGWSCLYEMKSIKDIIALFNQYQAPKTLSFYDQLMITESLVQDLLSINSFFDSHEDLSITDMLDDLNYQIKLSELYQRMKKLMTQSREATTWIEVLFSSEVKEYLDFEAIDSQSSQIVSFSSNAQLRSLKRILFQKVIEAQEVRVNLLSRQLAIKNITPEFSLKKFLRGISGFIPAMSDAEKQVPEAYSLARALKFNRMMEVLEKRLAIEGGLSIPETVFSRALEIVGCFQDMDLAIAAIFQLKQVHWERGLLVENIIDKYVLLFPTAGDVDTLRFSLGRADKHLLLLFSNLLVTEYADQLKAASYATEIQSLADKNTVSQRITQAKFISIVKYMKKVILPSAEGEREEALKLLAGTSLAVWDVVLYEHAFNQRFNKKFSELKEYPPEEVDRCLLYFNRVRVSLGVKHAEMFKDFFDAIFQRLKGVNDSNGDLRSLLFVLHALNTQKISLDEGRDVVSHHYSYWKSKAKEIIEKKNNHSADHRSIKSVFEIILEHSSGQVKGRGKENTKNLSDQQEKKDKGMDLKRIAMIKKSKEAAIRWHEKVETWKEKHKGKEKSFIAAQLKEHFDNDAYRADREAYVQAHLDQVLSLIIFAWFVSSNKTQSPKGTQIAALALFVNCTDRGLLQQIKTGEGKTLIVGLTAAFKALCGYSVDIVSSNRDLAMEGNKKTKPFFELLNLNSAHNCSDAEEDNKRAYESPIVYGEVGGFQRDLLEKRSKNKETLGSRYDRKKWLIVDEVDSMCLDKASHVLYLSHEIESLKWLETVFMNIWIAVLKSEVSNSQAIEEQVEKISQFISAHIKNRDIAAPSYLFEYIDSKIKRWVESAFQARFMKEDDQFVLDVPKGNDTSTRKHKSVIVVDKDTGVEQYSTRWSNGLAQFMELKYRRRLSPESLKAVFMSNKVFFTSYGSHLFGLTGTLGSERSRAFLEDLYPVDLVDLPTSKPKRYEQWSSKICDKGTNLLQFAAQEVHACSQDRPVLVICENVDEAKSLVEELLRIQSGLASKIKQYIRDGDNIEEHFRKEPAKAGDIIISTNKGGRGTDIEVSEEANKEGGLHVIATFLPDNVRIEDQAFGRTSRNGNPGSGQFILQVDLAPYREMYGLTGLTGKKLEDKLNSFGPSSRGLKGHEIGCLADVIVEREKQARDAAEAARLESANTNILRLDLENTLLEKFEKFKSTKIDIFKEVGGAAYPNKKAKDAAERQRIISEALCDILNDRWAFWLDNAKESIDAVQQASQTARVMSKFEVELIQTLESKLPKDVSLDSVLQGFIKTPEEAIKLGRAFMVEIMPSPSEIRMDHGQIWERNTESAQKCFKRAIELGDITGAAAMFLGQQTVKAEGDNDKKRSRHYLKESLRRIEEIKRETMANFKLAQLLPQMSPQEVLQKVSSKENLYESQLQGRLDVIGIHLRYLKKAIGETVDVCDFLPDGQEATDEAVVKARKIYEKLVERGVIFGDVVRKTYRTNPGKMREFLATHLDPSIAGNIADLLRSKGNHRVTQADFEGLVCSNEELWHLLQLESGSESVLVLNVAEMKKSLEQRFADVWKILERDIVNPASISPSFFEQRKNITGVTEFHNYIKSKGFLSQDKRVPVSRLDPMLANHDKYKKVVFNQNGTESSLVNFLSTFKKTLQENETPENPAYIYQSQLPFASKSEEAAKIFLFLKEQNILKSGGILAHKYRKEFEKFSGELDELLQPVAASIAGQDLPTFTPFPQTEEQKKANERHIKASTEIKELKDFIKGKLSSLQGELREMRDLKASLKRFEDINELENYPSELKFFEGLGLGRFLVLEEDKSWWDWGAFAVILIGVLQIIAGAVLCVFGLENIGNALISEGLNDIVYAMVAWMSGKFSWKDWVVQKAISFSISMATAGIQTLASLGKTAAKLGSVSTMAVLAKALVKGIVNFAVNMATNLLTEGVLNALKKGIIDKVLQGTLNGLLDKATHFIKSELVKLSQRMKVADLVKIAEEVSQKFHELFASAKNIIAQFEGIGNDVASLVQEGLKTVLSGFKNSNSAVVKIASTVLDVAGTIAKVWSIVEQMLQGGQAVAKFVESLKNVFETLRQPISATPEDQARVTQVIEQKVHELRKMLEKFIDDHLTKVLKSLLEKAVSGNLTKIVGAMGASARDFVDSSFKKSNSVRSTIQEDKMSTFLADAVANATKTKEARLADLANKKNELVRTTVQSLSQVAQESLGKVDIQPLRKAAESVRREFNNLKTSVEKVSQGFDVSALKKTAQAIKTQVEEVRENCTQLSNSATKKFEAAKHAVEEEIAGMQASYNQEVGHLKSDLIRIHESLQNECVRWESANHAVAEWVRDKIRHLQGGSISKLVFGSDLPTDALAFVGKEEIKLVFDRIKNKFQEITQNVANAVALSPHAVLQQAEEHFSEKEKVLNAEFAAFKSEFDHLQRSVSQVRKDILQPGKKFQIPKGDEVFKALFNPITALKNDQEFLKGAIKDFSEYTQEIRSDLSHVERQMNTLRDLNARLETVKTELLRPRGWMKKVGFKENLLLGYADKIARYQEAYKRSIQKFQKCTSVVQNFEQVAKVFSEDNPIFQFVDDLHAEVATVDSALKFIQKFSHDEFNEKLYGLMGKFEKVFRDYGDDPRLLSVSKKFSDFSSKMKAASQSLNSLSKQCSSFMNNQNVFQELGQIESILKPIFDFSEQAKKIEVVLNSLGTKFKIFDAKTLKKIKDSTQLIAQQREILENACSLEKLDAAIISEASYTISATVQDLKEQALELGNTDLRSWGEEIQKVCASLAPFPQNWEYQLQFVTLPRYQEFYSHVKSDFNQYLSGVAQCKTLLTEFKELEKGLLEGAGTLSESFSNISLECEKDLLGEIKKLEGALETIVSASPRAQLPSDAGYAQMFKKFEEAQKVLSKLSVEDLNFQEVLVNPHINDLESVLHDVRGEQWREMGLDNEATILEMASLAEIDFRMLSECENTMSLEALKAVQNTRNILVEKMIPLSREAFQSLLADYTHWKTSASKTYQPLLTWAKNSQESLSKLSSYSDKFVQSCGAFIEKAQRELTEKIIAEFDQKKDALDALVLKFISEEAYKIDSDMESLNKHLRQFKEEYKALSQWMRSLNNFDFHGQVQELLPKKVRQQLGILVAAENPIKSGLGRFTEAYSDSVKALQGALQEKLASLQEKTKFLDKFCEDMSRGVDGKMIKNLGLGLFKPSPQLAKKLTNVESFTKRTLESSFWNPGSADCQVPGVSEKAGAGLGV